MRTSRLRTLVPGCFATQRSAASPRSRGAACAAVALALGVNPGCFSDPGRAGTTSGDGEADTSSESAESTTESTTGSSCGDGVVDADEECDDGTANNDNAACTDACQVNICGDSLVLQGAEDCDDGAETALCNADCTAAACGDGIVNASAGEVCEGDVENGTCDGDCKVACTAGFASCDSDPDCETPVWTDATTCGGCDLSCAGGISCKVGICDGKRVFVTDATYRLAELTGLDSIHAACQAEADAAGLSDGTFRAWISDAAGPDGFAESSTPYVRVDGVVVANDFADLVDGTLSAAINITATGGVPSVDGMSCHGGTATCPFVYTGLTSAGVATGLNCGGWADTAQMTGPGDMTKTDSTWSDAGLTLPCLPAARFYCFEQ